MVEARNLIALSNAQTPLLGGENTTLLEGTGFQGATPKHAPIQTPNPMATPLRNNTSMDSPFKTPREERVVQTQRKRSLLQGLSSLPKPRNEWEIKLPEMDDEPEKKSKTDEEQALEDMGDYEREMKEAEEKEAEERKARRSLAVQLGLPRPTSVPKIQIDSDDEIEKMVQTELIKLLQHDAVKYPVAGGKIAPGATQLDSSIDQLEDEFDSISLNDARKELDEEIKKTLGLDNDTNVKKAVWDHVSAQPSFEKMWDHQHQDLLFSVKLNRFVTLEEMDDEKDIIQGFDKIVEVSFLIIYKYTCYSLG